MPQHLRIAFVLYGLLNNLCREFRKLVEVDAGVHGLHFGEPFLDPILERVDMVCHVGGIACQD
jgi:hypothetical protein